MDTPVPAAQERRLPLQGTFNFRDLGGYPTVHGRETAWGRVFRSDALHHLTGDDQAHLQGLGLATVVDLRGPGEAERVGTWPPPPAAGGPGGRGDILYVNLPVIPPDSWEDPTVPTAAKDGRAERYLWYLEVGAEALTGALELIARREQCPLVFHCAAGKDRTGIVAALALATVGVERDAIVADYVATTEGMHGIMDRLRSHPVYQPGIDSIRPEQHLPDAQVMEHFLDGLEERYGGAEAWLLSAGISPSTVDRLRTTLLT
jgi:protein-tyrosine phosphatase